MRGSVVNCSRVRTENKQHGRRNHRADQRPRNGAARIVGFLGQRTRRFESAEEQDAKKQCAENVPAVGIVPGEDRGRKVSKHQLQQMKAEHEASQIQPHKLVKSSLVDRGKQTFTEHFLAVNVKGNLRSEDPQAVLQRYASLGGGEGIQVRGNEEKQVDRKREKDGDDKEEEDDDM